MLQSEFAHGKDERQRFTALKNEQRERSIENQGIATRRTL